MVTIRLAPIGKKGEDLYKISVSNHRAKLTGRFLEKIGIYRAAKEETFLDMDRYNFWLAKGAQPTPRVLKIIKNAKPMPQSVAAPAPKARVAPPRPQNPVSRAASSSRTESSGSRGAARGAGRSGNKSAQKKS